MSYYPPESRSPTPHNWTVVLRPALVPALTPTQALGFQCSSCGSVDLDAALYGCIGTVSSHPSYVGTQSPAR